jgi:hypothetical protein
MKGKIKNMVEFINGLDDNQLEFLLQESGTQTTLDKELIYLTCETFKSYRSGNNVCTICDGQIVDTSDISNLTSRLVFGHNAWPYAKGECCDTCNKVFVIPARVEQLNNLSTLK